MNDFIPVISHHMRESFKKFSWMYSTTFTVPGLHSRRTQPLFIKFRHTFIEHILGCRCWTRVGRQSFLALRQAFQEVRSGVHTNIAKSHHTAEPKKCYSVMLIKYYGSSESGKSLKDSFNGGDILVGLWRMSRSLQGRKRGRQRGKKLSLEYIAAQWSPRRVSWARTSVCGRRSEPEWVGLGDWNSNVRICPLDLLCVLMLPYSSRKPDSGVSQIQGKVLTRLLSCIWANP